jgi:hypothetical protein
MLWFGRHGLELQVAVSAAYLLFHPGGDGGSLGEINILYQEKHDTECDTYYDQT